MYIMSTTYENGNELAPDSLLRILLVEDDEDDYVLTKALLEEAETPLFDLHWLHNYELALDAMSSNLYDVYLVDYRIGAQNGVRLLREARLHGCKKPVIILTGQGDHAVDVAAMRAGAADYLVKEEISARDLERAIRYAMRQKQAEAELAEMQNRLADSSEAERLHWARELHDGPLQDLIGVRLLMGYVPNLIDHCQSIMREHGLDLAPMEDSLHQFEQHVDMMQGGMQTVIDRIRALCRELRPPALMPFGLEQAIRAHVQHLRRTHPQLTIELNLDEDGLSIDESTRLALYRIYQHALVNVVKHANASCASVTFRLDDKELCLKVQDNGCGFHVPERWLELARNGHLGLLGVAERAEAIGGHLEVHSTPGQGTLLSVVAPTNH